MLGPGGPFETENTVIDGIAVRSFVRGPATMLDAFRLTALHGDATHLVLGEDRRSFTEIRRSALSVAARLRADFDVAEGDRVAIAMRNLPEFVIAFWSAAVLGAVVVPLNAWWAGPELRYGLDTCGAKVVFADGPRVARLTSEHGEVGATIVAVEPASTDPPGVVRFDDLCHGDELAETEWAAVGPDQPALFSFTSGTTGRPKGAVATHRNMMANLMNMGFATLRESLLSGRTAPPPGQAASISAAPLFHIGGIAAIVGGAMSGMKIVMLTKWNVDEAVEAAIRERITSFGGVPMMAREILEHPKITELLGQVRGFPMGGAAVPPELPRRAAEVFGGSLQLLNGYGATETTSAVVTNVGVEYDGRVDSVGRINLTAELTVLDADGSAVGPNEIGELCFRSPQVVRGYWEDPAATSAAFVDGWFRTGDLGYIDPDGFVYVVDRLKDVVIRGGENIYCAEVEAVLFEHPALVEAAVIGLPDETMGERVCAVVVPRADTVPDLADLRAFAADRLAVFKCPEAMYIARDVPRTATGKIAKKALRTIVSEDLSSVVTGY
ncbi:acyl--CoA ligase [Nocardia sp. NEAU-351]|uniref:Acyl--CoA ligase n=1 Tax=Nocardia bovistercoris TaxID=2785916 RepID=A0A931N598_9NOCA|nr:acyl--CoA ligase [Nocardia bovistercoris]